MSAFVQQVTQTPLQGQVSILDFPLFPLPAFTPGCATANGIGTVCDDTEGSVIRYVNESVSNGDKLTYLLQKE